MYLYLIKRKLMINLYSFIKYKKGIILKYGSSGFKINYKIIVLINFKLILLHWNLISTLLLNFNHI